MVKNQLQRHILINLKFYEKGARYSEIKPQGVDNDLFNYHLQQLVIKGYIDKKEQIYNLTIKGKSIVTNIDEETEDVLNNYKVGVYLCLVDKNKVLLHKRLKHPQYGYIGLVSGKVRYGEKILDTAAREFKEETNLDADFKVIGNMRQIRRDDEGRIIEDGLFYICYSDQYKGNLAESGPEGEYFWHDINEIKQLEKIFKPSFNIIMEEVKRRIEGKEDWKSKFIYELEPNQENY